MSVTYRNQDQITDLLLAVHRQGGMQKVKSLLRCAIVNFSAEYSTTGEVDEEIVQEIAEAVTAPRQMQWR
jgi:hypothetical protein